MTASQQCCFSSNKHQTGPYSALLKMLLKAGCASPLQREVYTYPMNKALYRDCSSSPRKALAVKPLLSISVLLKEMYL